MSPIGQNLNRYHFGLLNHTLTEQVTLRAFYIANYIGGIITLIKTGDGNQSAQYQFTFDKDRLPQITWYLLTDQDDRLVVSFEMADIIFC